MKFKYFMDADKGGGAGGSAAVSSPEVDIQAILGIDPNDLDEATRNTLQEKVATLQKATADALALATSEQQNARKFQSEKDRLTVQVQALAGVTPHKAQVDPQIEQIRKSMIARGVKEEAATAQAPIMADILKEHAQSLKQEIGQGFAPIVQQVMGQQANTAFQQAAMSDPYGRFAIPEVAQKVWSTMEEMVKTGQPIDSQIANNLASMAYFEHQQNGGRVLPPAVQPAPQARNFSSGGFSYPGAGYAQRPGGGNASPSVSPDTAKAMSSIMAAWGIKPKGAK